MIALRPRPLALVGVFLLAASAVSAAEPETPAPSDAQEEKAETTEAQAPAQDSAAEDKRICRYVKLDMSSRRKTKVCRTTEEWRELNNPR